MQIAKAIFVIDDCNNVEAIALFAAVEGACVLLRTGWSSLKVDV